MDKIHKKASMIIKFIDEIVEDNTKESFINEVEFEFGDKYDCYKTNEFKEILDDYFEDKNITYEFTEVRNHVAYFKFKLHNWISN